MLRNENQLINLKLIPQTAWSFKLELRLYCLSTDMYKTPQYSISRLSAFSILTIQHITAIWHVFFFVLTVFFIHQWTNDKSLSECWWIFCLSSLWQCQFLRTADVCMTDLYVVCIIFSIQYWICISYGNLMLPLKENCEKCFYWMKKKNMALSFEIQYQNKDNSVYDLLFIKMTS